MNIKKQAAAIVTKVCTKCHELKILDSFPKRSGGVTKQLYKSWCKDCHYSHNKEWRQDNQELIRQYRAKDKWTLQKRCARHGITPEEFWSIYEEQDGSCPVCDKAIEAEDSAIDHNHKTGEVRGILCKSCNRALGLLGDSPDTMFRGFTYLQDRGHYGDG